MKNIQLDVWYRIPGYNGYEIQFTPNRMHNNSYPVVLKQENITCWFWMRSWKNFKRYPYGYILPYSHKTKDGGYSSYYELSDLSNNRKRLVIKSIAELIRNADYNTEVGGSMRNIGSRNRILEFTDKKTVSLGGAISRSSLIQKDETSH